MIVERTLPYTGLLGTAPLKTLFDSGATLSCINPEKAKQIATPFPLHQPFEVGTAHEGTFLKINEFVQLGFELEGHKLWDLFVLVPGLSAEVVIGVDTLQKYHAKLDFQDGTITLDPNAGKLMLM